MIGFQALHDDLRRYILLYLSALSANGTSFITLLTRRSDAGLSRPFLPKLEAAVWVALLATLSHGRRRRPP